MNNAIHITDVSSENNPADCSPSACSEDEFTHVAFVTVIAVGVAEMVTTVVTVAVIVTNCTSVLVLVVMVVEVVMQKPTDVECVICVFAMTDVQALTFVQEKVY